MAISRSLREYWREIGEGYDLYWLDSGTAGEDDILTGTNPDEPLRDVLFHIGAEELPEGWEIRRMDMSEFQERMDNESVRVSLGDLREYPGWQDAGQTGEDDSLTDDVLCFARADGSVGTETGGELVDEVGWPLSDDNRKWLYFLSKIQ